MFSSIKMINFLHKKQFFVISTVYFLTLIDAGILDSNQQKKLKTMLYILTFISTFRKKFAFIFFYQAHLFGVSILYGFKTKTKKNNFKYNIFEKFGQGWGLNQICLLKLKQLYLQSQTKKIMPNLNK